MHSPKDGWFPLATHLKLVRGLLHCSLACVSPWFLLQVFLFRWNWEVITPTTVAILNCWQFGCKSRCYEINVATYNLGHIIQTAIVFLCNYLLKVITDNNCDFHCECFSWHANQWKKRSCILYSICVPWFQHFILGLLEPSHANDIG